MNPYTFDQAGPSQHANHSQRIALLPNVPNTVSHAQPEPRIESPLKRRRKLNFVKCDRCRKDKKKCTPTNRDWLRQKCDRCQEEELECSEGRQKARDSKRKRTQEQAVPRGMSVTSVPERINNMSAEDWSFLVSYQALLLRYIHRLRELQCEQRLSLNDLEIDADFDYDQFECLNFANFFDLFNTITSLVFDGAKIAVTQHQSNFLLSGLLPLFASHMHTEESNLVGRDILAEFLGFPQNDANRLLCALARMKYAHHNMIIKKNLKDVLQLSSLTQTKTSEILQGLSIDLTPTPYWGLFLPEEISRLWTVTIDVSELFQRRDCLGRTRLHQILDVESVFRPHHWSLTDSYPHFLYNGDTSSIMSKLDVKDARWKDVVDTQDILGRTCLHLASMRGNGEITRILLEAGANPILPTNSGLLPIHFAAVNQSPKVCEMLLFIPSGCGVNQEDKFKIRPITYAIKAGNVGNVGVLLKSGLVDTEDDTLLYEAASQGNTEIVRLLLDAGTNPNPTSIYRNSALSMAIQRKYLLLTKLISGDTKTDINMDTVRTTYGAAFSQLPVLNSPALGSLFLHQ
ncbi:ankyrin [Massarina eburnea CBS 473.64]|uniref:Ankyrin n=1 Tax=Massarina eburnea CBS 473.64 TaxID=1395130 RepID=A0A6A6S8Z0_9PLEO|nr:ankyrin [Massarina eburnea CBS 473.64]